MNIPDLFSSCFLLYCTEAVNDRYHNLLFGITKLTYIVFPHVLAGYVCKVHYF